MNRKHSIIVSNEESGQRLDQFLTTHFPNHSRNSIQLRISNERISVNGKPVKPKYIIRETDRIEVESYDNQPLTLEPDPKVRFSVIFEDEHILVINKPSNLVVHPGSGTPSGTLVHGLLNYDYDCFSRLVGRNLWILTSRERAKIKPTEYGIRNKTTLRPNLLSIKL